MLVLKNITKEYKSAFAVVNALRGVDIAFRKSEFVSVLGPSGCGKTTLLNIIGGLDRYTQGDLVINGRSTKEYKDSDWDTYRNHSIGFVFQTYNLIPHQTVLANVELALTLSGISKADRRRRAEDVLGRVGLSDQIKKRPNQLSGGQMQRVAIARALINDPDILLADEPTGALDTDSSVQIMDILKEVASDRLVIMVTHNPDLAEKYSTRIIRLLDGKVTGDTNPFEAPALLPAPNSGRKDKRPSMSFLTALALSLNNLMTKRGRTVLTAFAGSIGIIGIALIMALSSGFQEYISGVEENTLSSYPITIERETVDFSSMMSTMMGMRTEETDHELDKVYSNPIMADMLNSMMSEVQTNDLGSFMEFIEDEASGVNELVNAVQYGYGINLNVYSQNWLGTQQVNPSRIFEQFYGLNSSTSNMMSSYSYQNDVWQEMIGNQTLIESQYEMLSGKWPEAWNEVILIVDENNEISDIALYSMGLKDLNEVSGLMNKIIRGEEIEKQSNTYSYGEILELEYRIIPESSYYRYDETSGTWSDMREDEDYMTSLLEGAEQIKIVGILRPSSDSVAAAAGGAIGYTSKLTDHVMEIINSSEIVTAQKADKDTDVITGLPFSDGAEEPKSELDMSKLTPEQQAQLSKLSEAEMKEFMEKYGSPAASSSTFEENLEKLGVADVSEPKTINLYAKDFEAKEMLAEIIEEYNRTAAEEKGEEYMIEYTDYVGLIMSSVSKIINTISYVLIAFVAISLVVSSIMIGIITYISVLERTREIGVLRSIGASKRDISRVFNAETFIVGFIAGAIGIGITVLLCIPINALIEKLAGIPEVSQLPPLGGAGLIAVSVVLTLLAGLIPSRLAAKKDPAVALRSE